MSGTTIRLLAETVAPSPAITTLVAATVAFLTTAVGWFARGRVSRHQKQIELEETETHKDTATATSAKFLTESAQALVEEYQGLYLEVKTQRDELQAELSDATEQLSKATMAVSAFRSQIAAMRHDLDEAATRNRVLSRRLATVIGEARAAGVEVSVQLD